LQELGYTNWKIFEKENQVGGISASFIDSQGFTWDLGGHVIFSHYPYFDSLLKILLENEINEHLREKEPLSNDGERDFIPGGIK
jgi:protoporphyrinogen oxidase